MDPYSQAEFLTIKAEASALKRQRRNKSGRHLWDRHPHTRSKSELTFGEKAADIMRNGFGSWTFVGTFAIVLVVWMGINSYVLTHVAHGHGFDPYPYILLNLCLSCLAALQGAFILIAQKRADRISAELATSHYDETHKLDTLLQQNTELTQKVAELTQLTHDIVRGASSGRNSHPDSTIQSDS